MRWKIVLLAIGLCCGPPAGRSVAADDGRDLTLVVTGGWVMGIEPDGKPVWKFPARMVVTRGQMVGKDRVLLASGGGGPGHVVEKDLTGKTVWSKAPPQDPGGASQVRAVQRLAGGATLIAGNTRVVVFDPDGKETELYRRVREGGRGIYEIVNARKLPDGRLAVLTSDAVFRLLDDKGKELKSFLAGKQDDFIGPENLAVTPDGGVVLSMWGAGKVVKFDVDGKRDWEVAVKTPTSVTGLPNGNVLVSSYKGRYVVELDGAGKEVWRYESKWDVSLAGR